MDKSAKKKVNKYDLKKLASLGLASGLMMAAAPVQADTAGQLSGTYLAHSCGGNGGSGHQCGGRSNSNQGQNQWQSQNQQAPRQSSCNSVSQRSPSQSCNSKHGCGGSQNYSNVPYYTPNNESIADNDATAAKASSAAMSESEFMSQLNAQNKATFQSMSPEGKALAMKLAQQECKGKNSCKGLNSCKGKGNDCAGKGSCKGTSSDKFKDKNLAVKVASMKMAEKREGSLAPSK